MPHSTKKEHTYAKIAFSKSMKTLKGKTIDNYALFYRGFRTGLNYYRKYLSEKNEQRPKTSQQENQ